MKQNDSRADKTGVWRRLLSVVLAVCMVISMTPAVMAEGSLVTTAEDTPIVTTSPEVTTPAELVTQATEPAEPAPTEPTVTYPVPEVTTPTDSVPEVTTPTDPVPEVTDPTEPVPEEPVLDSEQVELIKQLISALPFEVTEENSEEVRMRLQDILSLYSQLTPEEQEAVDITLCYLLQMQLDEIDSAQTLEETSGITVDENGVTTIKINEVTNEHVWIKEDGVYIIEGDGTEAKTSIEVYPDISPTITLRNVNIKSPNADYPPFIAGIDSSGTVTIILEGNNILTTSGNYRENHAALQMSSSSGASSKPTGKLIIKEGSSGGSLTAIGSSNAFGIGSPAAAGYYTNDIIIESGTIIAKCNKGTAGGGGIGGIDCDITIKGGTIEAYTNENYAFPCIGTVDGGSVDGGSVTINGGNIKAEKSGFGACIGGQNNSCTVTITGGTINATNTGVGTCIGGSGSNAQDIQITGGIINAIGAKNAIGCGISNNAVGTIEISGGVVKATTTAADGSGVGIGGGNMIFTTGTNGHAIINTSSISDQSGKDSWSGVILEGDTWTVYGIPTVTDSFTVEAGQTLTVEDGKTLTLGSDANGNNITVTNGGVIAIEYGGTINGNGIITGSGSFTTENLTEDMIILSADLAYNGEDRSNEISENISYGTATICGQEFTFDSLKWKVKAVTTTDNYNYMVEFVYNDTETKTFSISLAQSGTEFAEGSVATYKNDMAAAEFAYGETVTVKAKPVPTGEAPAMAVSTFSLTEPTVSQMALYYNDIQMSEPANADENGLYTMTVPVSELISAGAGYDTPVTLTAKFIGDEKMDDAEATVEVTLRRAQLIAAATIADKVYDGTNTAAVSSVTFTDSNGNTVELGEADYTAAAEFADANAGENKPATVTVTLSENSNYTLTESTVNATGTVTARTLTEEQITVTLDNDTFTWAGVEIKPISTLTWDNNGTPVTIDSSEYVVSYSNNGGEGSSFGFDKTPEVCITAKEGGNYSFEVIYISFTITCNHNFGVTGGCCNGCGKQADVEVIDGTTSQGYFGTTDAPIDKAKLEEIVKNADAQSRSSGNPVTVKLYSGWTVPSNFSLKVNDKINFVADENQEFKADSIFMDSPAAELTLDISKGTFANVISSWESVKFTLNNGTITQKVSLSDNNSFIMNGGTVGYISDNAKTAPSSVTITGGTVRITLTALPATNLTVTGGTIGELIYNGTGAVTNTKLSGGSFTTITLPEGEPVSSILADGYAFYDSATNTEVTDTTVSTLSNVFVAKAGSHVVSADLDFTGEVTNPGDLETDGYHWESLPDTNGDENKICTLTLKDCIVPGNIALPDNAESITIILQGESSVGGFVSTRGPKYGDEYQYPQYAYNIKIAGSGSLAIGGILGGSGADHNQITIDSGANVTVSGDVQYGASGGVNGVLTVNGSLTVNSQSYAAVYGGRLVIGASGNLSVSGARGVLLGGTSEGYANAFVINEGAVFTANCTDYNIWVYGPNRGVIDDASAIVSIPDGYIADGYAIRYVNNDMFGLSVVPQNTPDSSLLNGTGMGGYLALKHQLHYEATIEGESYDYTGAEITPAVTVTCEGAALTEDVDYTVTYINNVTPGTAKVIIKGINNPDLNITKTFEIICTHTAGNKDTGVCSICHKQMAAGAIRYNYSTQKTECRFFDDLVDAWNYALDNSCENLHIYADVTVDQVLEIPAGKELYLNVKNNKTLTGTAISTIDVYGTLVLGEGTIKNTKNCSIRVYADANEYGYTVFQMDEQNKTVDGVEVYGTGKVELRACSVTDHITVTDGRTVKELLYVGSTYKSADGWFTEDALNATTLRGPVDIVDAPVAFQGGYSESKLNPEYKQGSTAEPLFARLYSSGTPAVQWYTIVDGTETPIEGATELVYTPSVAEVGVTQYFCQGTLDGYTARSVIFTVTVTPCEHTAINMENNTCADCGTPLAAMVSYVLGSGELTETPPESVKKYFEAFAAAWEYAATTAPSEHTYVTVFADQTVEAPLVVPEGRRISLSSNMGINGGTATITGTGEATVIVNGELNLSEIAVRNNNHHTIRVDSAVSSEGEYALSLTSAGSSPTVVDGLDVINGSVMIYGGTVEDHITLSEGRRISELLEEYSGKTFKYVTAGADGVSRWMSAAGLEGSSVNESVTVAQMPVRFLNTDTLTCRYEKGAAAEALAYGILYSDAYPNASADATVQWYKKTSADAEPVLIEGAATTSYTPDTSATGITQYYCVITLDGYTATSGIYEVTVTETFIVTVTSAVEGGEGTIAPVQGGGQYEYGQEVTVTAERVDGCKFLGWYNGSRQASADFSYTFTVTGNIDLVAKYESYGTATVTIEGINGAEFMVNHGAVQSTYTAEAPVGTQIMITAADPARVSAWLNGSDKVIGKGEDIAVIVTGNTTIKLMYTADGASDKAMVEYVSGYGQLLSYEYYSASDTIVEPVAPSKLGYTFTGWSLTAAEIQAKIAAGEKQITVTPVYTQNDMTFTVTVEYGDGTSETHAVAQGSGFTAVAKPIEGKVFTCWTDSENMILSYEPNYLIRVSSDVTLIAVYANEPVKAKPVVAITDKFASVVNGKNKVSFTATRSIPEGYELIEHGVLYGTDASLAQENALVLDGANVKKGQSGSLTSNGAVTMNISVGDMTDTTVYARGYMIVQNVQTSNIETIYSPIESGSFNGLDGNK